MREFIKEMLGFPWAMSLFGMNQVGKLIQRRDSAQVGKGFDAVTAKAADELGQTFRPLFDWGDKTQRRVVDLLLGGPLAAAKTGQPAPPAAAPTSSTAAGPSGPLPAGPNERLVICYTNEASALLLEPGLFDPDGRAFFKIDGDLYREGGQRPGRFEAAYGAQTSTFADFAFHPLPQEEPEEPFDKPPKRPWIPQTNWSKSRWRFEDGSELHAVGPELARTEIHKSSRTTQLWFAVSSFITSGSGAYKGARGQATSLGSVYLPQTPRPGRPAKMNAVHVLKFIIA